MASSSDTKDYKDHDKSHVDPETTDSDSASHHSLLKEERSDYFGISTLSPDFQGGRTTRLDRKESYKAQRRSYAKEKKRVERELLSTFKDQSIIVLADWLKVRGTLKGWTKLWCILKPGLLLLYRSPKAKSSHWIGTIILSTCELIERPSKKDGFCFKLFHPMDQSIWAARGPDGEAIGAVVQPLPTSHCIFRAPNSAAGKCWMDALELALRCSSLLLRTMASSSGSNNSASNAAASNTTENLGSVFNRLSSTSDSGSVCEVTLKGDKVIDDMRACASDLEDDFDDDDDEEEEEDEDEDSVNGGPSRRITTDSKGDESDYSEDALPYGENRSDGSASSASKVEKTSSSGNAADSVSNNTNMTKYVADAQEELFGTANDQTEEFSDENKSIVWFLVKQVRPGMDLSRVVLPTFILEPRSFLEKISDYYYHSDIISEAVKEEGPFNRMKKIVKWYLSGFYKKPKGLKKPYNPILGETFRCYWEHPNGSKTFYIAEQVSHHPPISANYVANREDGFTISASILAKSKFYGNSTSAVLEGNAYINLLPRGEEYVMTLPYAHCKGILMGTMTMELGGKVTIECSKTGYTTEMDFKLRPFLGGGEFTNAISGKIRLAKETLVTIDGHWDDCVKMKDKKTGVEEVLWEVTDQVRAARLKRFVVPQEEQLDFESTKLWRKVSEAIANDDQNAATEEKTVLEEAQRAKARTVKETGVEHKPQHFEYEAMNNTYVYKHADSRPWDQLNDLYQYEKEYLILTKTKHKTPMIRTQSIVSVSDKAKKAIKEKANKSRLLRKSASKAPNAEVVVEDETDFGPSKVEARSTENLEALMQPLRDQQRQMTERLAKLQHSLDVMSYQQKERDSNSNINRDMVLLVVLVVMIQAMLNWVLTTRAQAGGMPPLSSPPSTD
eukprot:03681.XXX_35529_43133_1 [CDS] Oithona nana genome sequencing.